MNDVSNRAVREFSEFLNSIEVDFPKPTCTTAYEITMKSTIVSALITLDTEKQMDERFWNHLRVQRNILDFLYTLWLDDDRTLVDEFSTIIKDLVELAHILDQVLFVNLPEFSHLEGGNFAAVQKTKQ